MSIQGKGESAQGVSSTKPAENQNTAFAGVRAPFSVIEATSGVLLTQQGEHALTSEVSVWAAKELLGGVHGDSIQVVLQRHRSKVSKQHPNCLLIKHCRGPVFKKCIAVEHYAIGKQVCNAALILLTIEISKHDKVLPVWRRRRPVWRNNSSRATLLAWCAYTLHIKRGQPPSRWSCAN